MGRCVLPPSPRVGRSGPTGSARPPIQGSRVGRRGRGARGPAWVGAASRARAGLARWIRKMWTSRGRPARRHSGQCEWVSPGGSCRPSRRHRAMSRGQERDRVDGGAGPAYPCYGKHESARGVRSGVGGVGGDLVPLLWPTSGSQGELDNDQSLCRQERAPAGEREGPATSPSAAFEGPAAVPRGCSCGWPASSFRGAHPPCRREAVLAVL